MAKKSWTGVMGLRIEGPPITSIRTWLWLNPFVGWAEE